MNTATRVFNLIEEGNIPINGEVIFRKFNFDLFNFKKI